VRWEGRPLIFDGSEEESFLSEQIVGDVVLHLSAEASWLVQVRLHCIRALALAVCSVGPKPGHES